MDKCKLENILTLTKSLSTLYLNGVLESSNESVRNIFEAGLTTTLKLQDKLYQAMNDSGYYNIANITESAINKTLTKLKKGTSE